MANNQRTQQPPRSNDAKQKPAWFKNHDFGYQYGP
jgi:hypothetical protein